MSWVEELSWEEEWNKSNPFNDIATMLMQPKFTFGHGFKVCMMLYIRTSTKSIERRSTLNNTK